MPGSAIGNRGWLVDIAVGGLVGGVLGAIVGVNLVIVAGPDEGYEAGIGDVFEHSAILGLVTIAVLVCGPLLGVIVARRLRRQRSSPG